MGLFEALSYNRDLAGARLLGKDTARITTPATLERVLALFDDAVRLDQLLRDVARAFRGAEDPIAEAEAFITQFSMGLRES